MQSARRSRLSDEPQYSPAGGTVAHRRHHHAGLLGAVHSAAAPDADSRRPARDAGLCYRAGRRAQSRRLTNEAVQEVISEASRVPKIYGIVVYDSTGRPLVVSDTTRTTVAAPGDRLNQVLAHGETVNFEQQIDRTPVYSVLRPIRRRGGRVTGVVQVAQSMALLAEEQRASTRRAIQNTLTLFAGLIVVTVALVRRFVGRPLERFLAGVRALERGELSYRLDEDQPGGELATLEREFNRMTGQLRPPGCR